MRGGDLELEKLNEKERGYLFGMFEGDGYKIHDKKGRHYHVEFYLNSERDKKIINYLVGLLKRIKLNPNLYQDKRFNCKRIRVYSIKLFSLINKNISLKDKNKNFVIGYVSGLIDSEGCINKKKSFIMVINTNLNILKQCQKSLDKIGINSTINKRKSSLREKLDSYRMYISVNFKSLSHLSIKVQERL